MLHEKSFSLTDLAWEELRAHMKPPFTATERNRSFVDALKLVMASKISWADATPEGCGKTVLYATVSAWATKEIMGDLIRILDQNGYTSAWLIDEIQPPIAGKRPTLRQFIGLKLLELRGTGQKITFLKDWAGYRDPSEKFVMTPEIRARNTRVRARVRERKQTLRLMDVIHS